MFRLSPEAVGLSIMVAAESAHAFSAHLPSNFTIRAFAATGREEEVQVKLAALRSGYAPAVRFAALLGIGASVLARSIWPAVAAVAGTALMVTQYEQAIPQPYRLPPLQAMVAGFLAEGAFSREIAVRVVRPAPQEVGL